MTAKQWIRRLKSVRARARKTSPQTRQIAAVSLVVTLSVAGIVLVANQASSSASAAPPAAQVSVAAPAPAKRTPLTKAKSGSATSASAASANATAANATAGNATTSTAQTSEVVTIAGCLEQSHDTFKLKDAEGADAPQSRNWKTVFLTKHASLITVIDSGNQLKLGSHVGERVSVTGTLADKEMQGRSLKKLDTPCE